MNRARTSLRLDEVRQKTGLGRTANYAAIQCGEVPAPVKITGKASGWIEDEVGTWQAAKIAERDMPMNKRAQAS